MNREDTREAAQVMMAYADGKEVEIRHRYRKEGWHIRGIPIWDWVNTEYRVKKRSGKVWLLIDPQGACSRVYKAEGDARFSALDSSSIVVKADWEEE